MTDAITVRLDDTAVIARLQQIAGRVDDMAPAMRAIGEALVESTKQRFDTSTGPDGLRWERHAAATVLGRLAQITGAYAAYTNVKTRKEGLRRVGDKKGALLRDGSLSAKSRRALEATTPLVDTGELRDGIRYQLSGDGRTLEVGTNRFAGEWDGGAAVHQFGDKKGRIPARPFLGVSAEDRGEVLDILDRFLAQALGR
jgi:phage gpG-like protein